MKKIKIFLREKIQLFELYKNLKIFIKYNFKIN